MIIIPNINDPACLLVRFRLVARILGLVLILVLGLWKGPFWSLGALMGLFLVDANLFLLKKAVVVSKLSNLKAPLRKMLLKFYLAFATTAFCCWLVFKFHVGHPLAFLAGLMIFFEAMALTILWVAIEHAYQAKLGKNIRE